MKILIVEDEEHIAEGIRFNLEAENFETDIAADGEIALQAIAGAEYDAIVLDVMLPLLDGFEVARYMRANENYTPILMLTARNRPEDVLRGFEAGADDYLPKPFELSIFLARLKGLLRRREWHRRESTASAVVDSSLLINSRQIDFENLELRNGEEVVHLTLMEAKLLRFLIENEGKAVSRKTILEDVWDLHEDTDTRAIDNFIVRLRKHIEDEPNNPKILQTVRGIGYRFVKK